MSRYRSIHINLEGCDDGTHLRIDGVPENVVEAFEYLASAVSEQGGGCRPTMCVHAADEPLVHAADEPLGDRHRIHWSDLTAGGA